MNNKRLRLILIHFLALCLTVLGVFVFVEEIQTVKQEIYYALRPTEIVQEETEETLPMEPFSNDPNAWYANTNLIYHAGGEIDGCTYTNSREAIENSLLNGRNVIEVDFLFTSDRQLVCAHEWEESYSDGYIPSATEFLNVKIQDRFTPITAVDLLKIMEDHPQMYLVIDTKEANLTLVIAELVSLAGEDPAIVDRFIIQLYSGYEKPGICRLYPFDRDQFLWTLYKQGNWDVSLLHTCKIEDIFILTTISGLIPDEDVEMLRQLGFVIYEHTVNQPQEANDALKRGICGVYTDSLTAADLDSNN